MAKFEAVPETVSPRTAVAGILANQRANVDEAERAKLRGAQGILWRFSQATSDRL